VFVKVYKTNNVGEANFSRAAHSAVGCLYIKHLDICTVKLKGAAPNDIKLGNKENRENKDSL